MTPPLDVSMDGAWRELFPQALVLMDALHQANPLAQWRFGGGTVLMLRYRHRLSKDIDLFIDDPQLLGFVNPRLSEVAESITADYQEGAEFVKLLLPQGEIDVVVFCVNWKLENRRCARSLKPLIRWNIGPVLRTVLIA